MTKVISPRAMYSYQLRNTLINDHYTVMGDNDNDDDDNVIYIRRRQVKLASCDLPKVIRTCQVRDKFINTSYPVCSDPSESRSLRPRAHCD
jgi:hypothetical protein